MIHAGARETVSETSLDSLDAVFVEQLPRKLVPICCCAKILGQRSSFLQTVDEAKQTLRMTAHE